jgi:hypothetical protein
MTEEPDPIPNDDAASQGAAAASETPSPPTFCPSCGSASGTTDRFCRRCGADLGGDADLPRSGRNRGPLLAVVALLAAVAAAAAVVVVGGGGDDKPKAKPNPAVAARRQLKKPFDAEMHFRDALFSTERDYRSAMRSTNRSLRRYKSAQKAYAAESKRIEDTFAAAFDACSRYNTPCPDPTYPDAPKVPSFDDDVRTMRAAASDLQTLRVAVSSSRPPVPLAVMHSQLLEAITALQSTASHNADVLSEAVTPAEGEGSGGLDNGKIATLRTEEALPAIKAMNAQAVALIRRMGLPLLSYDVPGGRDLDVHDNSVAQ